MHAEQKLHAQVMVAVTGNEAPPNAGHHTHSLSVRSIKIALAAKCIAPTSCSAGLYTRTASMEILAVSGVLPGSQPL